MSDDVRVSTSNFRRPTFDVVLLLALGIPELFFQTTPWPGREPPLLMVLQRTLLLILGQATLRDQRELLVQLPKCNQRSRPNLRGLEDPRRGRPRVKVLHMPLKVTFLTILVDFSNSDYFSLQRVCLSPHWTAISPKLRKVFKAFLMPRMKKVLRRHKVRLGI